MSESDGTNDQQNLNAEEDTFDLKRVIIFIICLISSFF